MIILDTNVLSELMRASPAPQVLEQVKRFDPQALFTTAITAAELRLGLLSLPSGRGRELLGTKIAILLEQRFQGRILPFDNDCASSYAALVVKRRLGGRPISISDAQIVAIAYRRGARLMTRNTRDFEHCEVPLIDPWEEGLPA